MKKEHEA